MNKQQLVKDFMKLAGQYTPDMLYEPDRTTRVLRLKLIAEELCELATASGVECIVNADGQKTHNLGVTRPVSILQAQIEAADAIADLLYVVYGAAVAWGIDIDAVFEEVHESNMSKFVDGSRRADGKWIKGPSYKPADISSILQHQQRNVLGTST